MFRPTIRPETKVVVCVQIMQNWSIKGLSHEQPRAKVG